MDDNDHNAAPWIRALRNSHNRLRALVEPLDLGQLEGRSYDSEWSIAQVLSHLGSQAEIFSLIIDAGLSDQAPPGQEQFLPIWEAWNARTAQAQANDALHADNLAVERFEALTEEERDRLHLEIFGMEVGTARLAGMRLGEHAVHTWDIAVALDPAATVASDAVDLLVDTLGQLATWSGKPDGKNRLLQVATTAPERHFDIGSGETVTFEASSPDDTLPGLQLPAEALVRLVYGRLDPAHTPAVEGDEDDLDDLRRLFPGF
jgi:uncharacterized protein (TIGR03083 family)